MAKTNTSSPLYGGRALTDGVMMVGPEAFAVAVRNSDGTISTSVEKFSMPVPWARNIPFLRGPLALAGAAVLAFRSSKMERSLVGSGSHARRSQMLGLMIPMVGVSLVERMGTYAFTKRKRQAGTRPSPANPLMLLFAFRLTGFTPAGRRLLQYHAAEHMAVNAVEARLTCDPVNAALQSRIHPRCGTTFAYWALLIGSRLSRGRGRGRFVNILLTIATVSVAFEIARLGASLKDRPWAKFIFGPSWQVQRFTTIPADREHLEVACTALKAVQQSPAPLDEPAPTGIV